MHEQIGSAVSSDGLNFTEHPNNPVAAVKRGAPSLDDAHSQTTPRTVAMAEGHVWMENGDPLVYVFHTIRWDSSVDAFAPQKLGGRNGEDLGVEVFSPTAAFELTVPAITPHWQLSLLPGQSSPCFYDPSMYRYCLPLKAVVSASGATNVLLPALSFWLAGRCAPPPPPTPPPLPPQKLCAENSTKCKASWHCGVCKKGASNPSDCMSCAAGWTRSGAIEGDCTLLCKKDLYKAAQGQAASPALAAEVEVYGYDTATDTLFKPALAKLTLGGRCGGGGNMSFSGTTAGRSFNATWVVAVVTLLPTSAPLADVSLDVLYNNTGEPVPRPVSPIPAPPPCAPAANSTKCAASWHCGVCKTGASNPSDCMSCEKGWLLSGICADCTGTCIPGKQCEAEINRNN